MPTHATLSPSRSQALAITSQLRQDGASAVLCYGTDEKPIQVGNTHIYIAKFPDDVTWAVRFPVHAHGGLPASGISSIVQAEMDLLAKLGQSGFRWSPKLIAGDSSFDNHVGCPYLVLAWIPGTELQWTTKVPSEKRQKILCQLTDIQLELAERTQESRHGLLAQDYLAETINHNIERVLNGQLLETDLRSNFTHRILARHAINDELEKSLFAVAHGNLGAHKIIVDDEYNIAGIIDWKLARLRPLQVALQLPGLLGVARDWTDSVETAHPSPVLLDDRQFVTSHLSSLTSKRGIQGPADHASLAQAMETLISDPCVDWRDLIIDSCFSKGLRSWMVKNSWLLDDAQFYKPTGVTTPSDEDVNKEIDKFLHEKGDERLTREELLGLCEGRKV